MVSNCRRNFVRTKLAWKWIFEDNLVEKFLRKPKEADRIKYSVKMTNINLNHCVSESKYISNGRVKGKGNWGTLEQLTGLRYAIRKANYVKSRKANF